MNHITWTQDMPRKRSWLPPHLLTKLPCGHNAGYRNPNGTCSACPTTHR